MMPRTSIQFHWRNNGYRRFDDFLATMSHDKRKKLRQERRRVAEAGITFRRLTGPDIAAADWDFFIFDEAGNLVTFAASLANPETVTIPDPVAGNYTLLADNYEAGSVTDDWAGGVSFRGPEPAGSLDRI